MVIEVEEHNEFVISHPKMSKTGPSTVLVDGPKNEWRTHEKSTTVLKKYSTDTSLNDLSPPCGLGSHNDKDGN